MKVYALKIRPLKHPFPIIAWLIMLFQGFNPFSKKAFSHNAILFVDKFGQEKVIDSTSKNGVKVSSSKEFFEKYKLVEKVELAEVLAESAFYSWLKKIEGRKYDRLQIIGLLLKALNILSFNKYGSNYMKLTCNEVLLNYLETFKGFDFGDTDNYDLIMTWEIVLSVKKDI